MYLQEISITDLRVFASAKASFLFPGCEAPKGRRLRYPNINLILGNNGSGKSSLLKAVALACLGPLAEKFSPYLLVRKSSRLRDTGEDVPDHMGEPPDGRAVVRAKMLCTWQDVGDKKPNAKTYPLDWGYYVERFIDEESVQLPPTPRGIVTPEARRMWSPVNDRTSPSFLTVGYGATRRVDTDPGATTTAQRLKTQPLRHQRVQSLFTEGYTLVSLGQWLPQLRSNNPGRFSQVCTLINQLLPRGISFTKETDNAGEYLFRQGGSAVPFAALSDGCRAFIGWVADLLYHICFGCPSGVKLVDNCGIVLVDEIDLHLHPEWQRTILPRLAKTFSNLQFIVTSHSPILVGTLQRENIWLCETPGGKARGSILTQKEIGVNGLNADQILLTEYFGMKSSRAPEKERELDRIAAAAERKVPGEAVAFMQALTTAMEDES